MSQDNMNMITVKVMDDSDTNTVPGPGPGPAEESVPPVENLVGPVEFQKLNSFSDILIKLLTDIDSRTRNGTRGSQPIPGRQLLGYVTSEAHSESLEHLDHIFAEHKKLIREANFNVEELKMSLSKLRSDITSSSASQNDLVVMKNFLQADFGERLDKVLANFVQPGDPEFPPITLDTTSEEMVRILLNRLQSLEGKVGQQQHLIDTLKRNIELEKEKSELLLSDFQTKFDGHDLNYQTQLNWNKKSIESSDLLTDLLKKHQKEYKTYITTQTTNNNKRDETVFGLQNQVKKLDKQMKQMAEQIQKLSANHPSPIIITPGLQSNNSTSSEIPAEMEALKPTVEPNEIKSSLESLKESESNSFHGDGEENSSQDGNAMVQQPPGYFTTPGESEPHQPVVHGNAKQKKNSKIRIKKNTKSPSDSTTSTQLEIPSTMKIITRSVESDEEIIDDEATVPSALVHDSINRDYEKRLSLNEAEISKINSTMEMVLQGFKQLGELLIKQTHAKAKKKMTMLISPNMSMPLVINLNQPIQKSEEETKTLGTESNTQRQTPSRNDPEKGLPQETHSESVPAAKISSINVVENSNESDLVHETQTKPILAPFESKDMQHHQQLQIQQELLHDQVLGPLEEDIAAENQPPTPHPPTVSSKPTQQRIGSIEEPSKTSEPVENLMTPLPENQSITTQPGILPMAVQQMKGTIDSHVTRSSEFLPSSQIVRQSPQPNMDHDPILIEVEEEVHQIIGALVQIGNMGCDLLGKDSGSIAVLPSLISSTTTANPVQSSTTSSRSNSKSEPKRRHNSLKLLSGLSNGSSQDQVIFKIFHELDEKYDDKFHQLENKLRTVDDSFRQLKIQVMSLQDSIKNLRSTNTGSGNSTSVNNSTSNPKSQKKSYKIQSNKSDKNDKTEKNEETNPDWFNPIEELKQKIQEIKVQFDQLLEIMKQKDKIAESKQDQSQNLPSQNNSVSNPSLSVVTQPVSYHDDDANISVGDMSLLTESMIEGGSYHPTHPPDNVSSPMSPIIPIQKTVFHVETETNIGSENHPLNHPEIHDTYHDMTDDLSDIQYESNIPLPASMLPIEQRIIKLEKLIFENELIPFADRSYLKPTESSESHNFIPHSTQESINNISKELDIIRNSDTENSRKIAQIQSDMLHSNEILNKLKYITDSLNVMSDELSSSIPREEFEKILTNVNNDLKGIKKSLIEKDWVQNKLQQKVDKTELDRLVSGITSLIGDPYNTSVVAMHKCLVCDKPFSIAVDGKPTTGYDKSEDPNLPHSPIKRPGTVSGRLSSNNYPLPHSNSIPTQASMDMNVVRTSMESLPLPPVVLPGGAADRNKVAKKPQSQVTRRIRSAAGGGLGGSYQIDTR